MGYAYTTWDYTYLAACALYGDAYYLGVGYLDTYVLYLTLEHYLAIRPIYAIPLGPNAIRPIHY